MSKNRNSKKKLRFRKKIPRRKAPVDHSSEWIWVSNGLILWQMEPRISSTFWIVVELEPVLLKELREQERKPPKLQILPFNKRKSKRRRKKVFKKLRNSLCRKKEQLLTKKTWNISTNFLLNKNSIPTLLKPKRWNWFHVLSNKNWVR